MSLCLAAFAQPAAARSWQTTALPAGSSFSEPGIATGAGALVAVNASTANSGSPAALWLSHDGGRRWSAATPIGGAGTSTGDSDAAIASDGTLYSLVLGYTADSNPSVLVFRSRDGSHWQGPASFPPPHGADQPDRPWLVLVRDRVLVFNSEGGGNVVEWSSDDHGASFAGPVPVTGGPNSEAGLALGSRPVVDPTDPSRLWLFYETAGGTPVPPIGLSELPDLVGRLATPPSEFPLTQLWVATSDDGGRGWANRLVFDAGDATIAHLLPAAAADRAGHLYVSLSVRPRGADATGLVLLRSTDHGTHWRSPVPIATPTPSNVMPALTATAPGRVFVSWYASDARAFTEPRARWSEMVATSGDALAARPRFEATRLSGAEPIHVGAIESAGAVGSDLGENWALRDFQSIAADACGRPHVTWAADRPAPRTYTAFLPGRRTATVRCAGR